MAAYPASYEFPYCPECKTPQGRHGQRAGIHSELPAARPKQISFKMAEHFPERDYHQHCDFTARLESRPPSQILPADIPPNYHELRGKNLEILGVAIRDEILKFGFVIEDFQVGILETPIQV